MDERVREHAAVLVDWSARIDPGDDVVLQVDEGARELADGEFDRDPAYERALYADADSVLVLKGTNNTAETADVPADRRQAYARARRGIREARLSTDWVSTQHPTRAMAQQAGMSYEAYRQFVSDATLRDWASLADEMAGLKALLDEGSEVRLSKRDPDAPTDLTMSVEGRTAVNSAASVAYDSHNLPSGEVFTAPRATEGEVTFDVPMTVNGTRVRDVRLAFEDGAVVDYAAAQGEDAVAEVLDTDEGARRLGELGVGMNRGIDRITDNILFDEKMGGTVHLALGRAYDACLPEGQTGNDSAVHVDLITDLRASGRLEVDGEPVLVDGRFRWEDGFEE